MLLCVFTDGGYTEPAVNWVESDELFIEYLEIFF